MVKQSPDEKTDFSFLTPIGRGERSLGDRPPHLPCGLCPIQRALIGVIEHCVTTFQTLQLFAKEPGTIKRFPNLQEKIDLVGGFLDELWLLYDILEESIKANALPEE